MSSVRLWHDLLWCLRTLLAVVSRGIQTAPDVVEAAASSAGAATITLLDRFLSVFKDDILPLTREGVKAGNRVFGAAVLRKSDLSLVIAGTNTASKNPLYHGEVSCLNNFYAIPAESRPAASDCIFLSTHEPCMC